MLNDSQNEAEKFSKTTGVLRSQILKILNISSDQIASEKVTPLSVEAHESSIYKVDINAKGEDEIHAIAKQYNNSINIERVREDVRVLEILYNSGVNVPKVLGDSPTDNLILMEYSGKSTLADLLKEDIAISENIWSEIMQAMARLHVTLNDNFVDDENLPDWNFTLQQRHDWAMQGLRNWCQWLPKEHEIQKKVKETELVVSEATKRLSQPRKDSYVIWGDCNPKNILLSKGSIRFIDFQLKRSSLMLDLVLLFGFADSPETYLPREKTHKLLEPYWSLLRPHFTELGSKADFISWYDDELLWRILVYGGMLLEKKETRLDSWSDVCKCMFPDLKELLFEPQHE